MPAGLHPANSLNHVAPDLGIPLDSLRSGSALEAKRMSIRIGDFYKRRLIIEALLRYSYDLSKRTNLYAGFAKTSSCSRLA